MDTKAMRRTANELETHVSPLATGLAIDKLRGAADEIDTLRAALHSVDETPAERLTRYRCAATSIIGPAVAAGRFGTVVDGLMPKVGAKDMAVSCEEIAHAMFAAERPPAATVATARPTVTEAQIEEWTARAIEALDDDSPMSSVVRHVLTLAGIESAEKGAPT